MTSEPQDPRRLIEVLLSRGRHFLYADYWLAYRLTFLSEEAVLATPLGRGTAGIVRHEGRHRRVEEAADPAFLLRGTEAISFRSFLEDTGGSFTIDTLEGFTLFTGVDRTSRARVAACRCIPDLIPPGAPLVGEAEGGSLSWGEVDGPDEMLTDQQRFFWVVLKNGSDHALASDLRLSYHWLRRNGSYAFLDGERTPLGPRPGPRQVVRVPVRVIANIPPGRYDLVVDLVDEKKWLEWEGVTPPRRRVRVLAGSP
jgi:hypothetical protein